MHINKKPILYNGYKIAKDVTIVRCLEQIFFTEVYFLSDDSFLYLLPDVNIDDIPERAKKYNTVNVNVNSAKYLGVKIQDHTHVDMIKVIKDVTIRHGFDCVAGMRELKNLLINDVINPLNNPAKYKKFNLSIPNGILLYGPPGCGKTFIVKKLAEELDYNFIELSPSSVATPYVHGAVNNINKVFDIARTKSPSIIFIDEIEGLLPRREDLSFCADTKKEEINEFLIQLNNASEHKILVVGATNRPHMIDLAILRSGRMDKRIYVGPPDLEARTEMFKLCLIGRPYDKKIDFCRLAEMCENYASSDIELIMTEAARTAVLGDMEVISEEIIIYIIRNFSPSLSSSDIDYYRQFESLQRF